MTLADRHEDAVQSALGLFSGERHSGTGVHITLSGSRLLCDFKLDEEEHRRRERAGIGAIQSTGLLHALWRIGPSPDGLDLGLTQSDHNTLLNAPPALVEQENGRLGRLYRPPGKVRLLVAIRQEADAAIRRAVSIPPAFRRAAVWSGGRSQRRRAETLLDVAASFGIGLGVIDDCKTQILSYPTSPQVGVPSVYGWWVSEVVYHRFLYDQMAHALS